MPAVGYHFGAAHQNAMHAVFGDNSVHTISYNIEREILDRMGDRQDGEPYNYDG